MIPSLYPFKITSKLKKSPSSLGVIKKEDITLIINEQ